MTVWRSFGNGRRRYGLNIVAIYYRAPQHRIKRPLRVSAQRQLSPPAATQRLRARRAGLARRAWQGGPGWQLLHRSAWADDAATGAERATTIADGRVERPLRASFARQAISHVRMRRATLARVSLDRNSSIQRTEESNGNDAAKQRRYGKRYQAKIGESRFEVVMHIHYIRAFAPPVYTRVSSHAQEVSMLRGRRWRGRRVAVRVKRCGRLEHHSGRSMVR